MSFDFINTLIEKLYQWAISELPVVIVVIVITIILLNIFRFIMTRLKKIILRRITKKKGVKTLESEKRVETLLNIVHSTGKIIIWVVAVMIILEKFGVNIGPILAGAGIVGLAVGFGSQELVRDYISGFFILLENQIRVGDVAIINGTGGLVENIELRTTSLRDFSGVVHIFQNGKINSISNMTKDWSAMVFDIGVAYKEDVEQVMEIMRNVGDELNADEEYKEKILEPLEIFGVDNFADSAVVIKARIKTEPIQQWTVGREFRKRLKKAFDIRGIEIPFPHTTVYWGEKIDPLQLKIEETKEKKEHT
jgi:moderate conductance mechanosensitive channel